VLLLVAVVVTLPVPGVVKGVMMALALVTVNEAVAGPSSLRCRVATWVTWYVVKAAEEVKPIVAAWGPVAV
jgi:hypothetical protein